VEPSDEFPLLQDAYHIAPCDREELCDDASLIFTTQLAHKHDNSFVEDTPAEVGHVHCIDIEKEELNNISSLNT
jgi:hypothetical protein